MPSKSTKPSVKYFTPQLDSQESLSVTPYSNHAIPQRNLFTFLPLMMSMMQAFVNVAFAPLDDNKVGSKFGKA